MRSTAEGPPCPPGVVETSSSNNNNNNNQMSSRENNGNSGSQYALCALGVGLIAVGVVMIVWSIVPANTTFNSSSSGNSGENGGMESKRHKASSVAFVLAGSGVAMLLLSLCLAMRNKQQERLRHQEVLNRREAEREQETETAEEQAQRYAVPSYEEVICSGQYPVRQSNLRPSVSQLPSYDELVQSDSIQYENEGAEVNTTIPQPTLACIAPCATVSTSSHRSGRNNHNFLPIKIRRIKSEKLPMKNTGSSQPTDGISIEPLTPPPQYEDKVPPL